MLAAVLTGSHGTIETVLGPSIWLIDTSLKRGANEGNNIHGSPKPSDMPVQMEMKQMYLQPGGLSESSRRSKRSEDLRVPG